MKRDSNSYEAKNRLSLLLLLSHWVSWVQMKHFSEMMFYSIFGFLYCLLALGSCSQNNGKFSLHKLLKLYRLSSTLTNGCFLFLEKKNTESLEWHNAHKHKNRTKLIKNDGINKNKPFISVLVSKLMTILPCRRVCFPV